jgi:hypothetical protein
VPERRRKVEHYFHAMIVVRVIESDAGVAAASAHASERLGLREGNPNGIEIIQPWVARNELPRVSAP